MVAGQLDNIKVGFVIQARMRSTRLPGKVLLPMPMGTGKPLLLWVVNEVKRSRFLGQVIIATSIDAENDILAQFCRQNSITCIRGDEENVLSRFLTIAETNEYDCIVRLTADNPIIDIDLLDETITAHVNNNNDYTRSDGLPIGMNFEVISNQALITTGKHETTADDKEHVTLFIKNSGFFKVGVLSPDIQPDLSALRLTVDYPSDYTLISSVLDLYNAEHNLKGIKLIKHVYDKYPWIFEANASNIQKRQYKDQEDELKAAVDILNNLDLKYSAGKLQAL